MSSCVLLFQAKTEFDKHKEDNIKLRDEGEKWHMCICDLSGEVKLITIVFLNNSCI